MINFFIFFILSLSGRVFATLESEYEAGKKEAQKLQHGVETAAVNTAPNIVPGFLTDNPAESSHYPGGNPSLADATVKALTDSESGNSIITSAKDRDRFNIEPKTDPLFNQIDLAKIEQNFDIKLSEQGADVEEDIEKNCEEGGEDVSYECFENLYVVPKVPLKTEILWVNHLNFQEKKVQTCVKEGKHWTKPWISDGFEILLPKAISNFRAVFCPNFKGIDAKTGKTVKLNCERIQDFKINGARSVAGDDVNWIIRVNERFINLTLIHDTYEGEGIEEWRGCENYEKLVEEGLCQYGGRVITKGPQTLNIEGQQVYKAEWQYKQTYHCKMIKDECEALRAQGCVQINSQCKEYKQGRCWIYEQKYKCPSGKKFCRQIKSPESQMFCLTGDCHKASYEANGEMLEVISRLNLLKEIQDDFRANGNKLPIFTGSDCRCSRDCLSFKDCCGGMKGWGMSLHLSNCKAEEKQLAMQREKCLCYQVGTYCSKKVLKKCVTKKTSFCCFGSKLARLLHEQGRNQLGISWGSPKEPNCRGLTIEEISKLDLSKMNFREMFGDIMKKYKAPDVSNLQQKTINQIHQNLQKTGDALHKTVNSSAGKIYDQKDTF